MMHCVSCGPTTSAPSPTLNKMCSRCWWNLPAATRSAYQHGSIGIKQIARASRDSQQSVRKFGGGRRLGVLVLLIALAVVAAGCGQRERERAQVHKQPVPETATNTNTVATWTATDSDLDAPLGSVQPNIRPLTKEEYWKEEYWKERERAFLEHRTATDTTQPLRRAPVHVVRFDRAALTTVPILDERKRECIAYPLNASFVRVRYNLLLQPNLYDVTIRNWSDPKWLATFHVDDGTFPVNLWRTRNGEPAFWKTVRVQAGPGLPTGNPQVGLSADFFRGGDKLCVETPRVGGAVFVAYDRQTGAVVQPQLSAIQNSSNDSTPIPGAWTTISGEVRQ